MIWQKKTQKEIEERIFGALSQNISYTDSNALGIPASHLDSKVFSQDESFLKNAPFISTMVQNPNHIGCHTLGESESYFQGTQLIEKEVIDICAVDILKAPIDSYDGYVASGGTEANIQAIWMYRNYFINEDGAKAEEVCILASEDTHYSMDKAANLLALDFYKVNVDPNTRQVDSTHLNHQLDLAIEQGKKHFIVICNMMTTMFGSIDDVNIYTQALAEKNSQYRIHVDGAYGGFYYPFTDEPDRALTFENPKVTSFTLDAHKMAQAPYGTGIFICRKGYINHTNTKEASYVEGEDCTLIGSRSGANAVAVWMILVKYGFFGWQEKIFILQKRSEWICKELEKQKISFYRNPSSNIITIRANCIKYEVAKKYGLVPDKHNNPSWYKIVVMEHVSIEKVIPMLEILSN
ncbi:MAG: aminotransferase class I/II-fold pyridoxal phosphate-dependent enzyme [Reichenbachiella sp.]